jgi:hypothetical protein
MSTPTLTPIAFDTNLSVLQQTSHQKQHRISVLWRQVFVAGTAVGCTLFIRHQNFTPLMRGSAGLTSFGVLLYSLNSLLSAQVDNGLEENRQLAKLLLECRTQHKEDWASWEETFNKYASGVSSLQLTVDPSSIDMLNWILEGFPHLHSLRLEGKAPLENSTLDQLVKMNALHSLTVNAPVPPEMMKDFSKFPRLQELSLLDDRGCDTQALLTLTDLPHLGTLAFICTDEKNRKALPWVQSNENTIISQLRAKNYQLFIQDSERSHFRICNQGELTPETTFYCLQFKRAAA